jgi:hypothetical protein
MWGRVQLGLEIREGFWSLLGIQLTSVKIWPSRKMLQEEEVQENNRELKLPGEK